MTGRTRALVQRAGRKQHFATLGPGETAWIAVCEVADVPVFGADVVGVNDWATWLDAARHDGGTMCVRCRNPLLVAALALSEVGQQSSDVAALEAELRVLRAEVARWTTTALQQDREHAEFLRDHVVFRRAVRDAS